MAKRLSFFGTVLSILLILTLAGCAGLVVEKPAGFAVLKSRKEYKAISPEGMRFRVRVLENEPSQALEFWSEALKNHLLKEGYTLVGEGESFQAGAGMLFEWAVPYGAEVYTYLTAIAVSEKKIAVAEASGEHTVYAKYAKSLKKSLEGISFQ